MTDAESGRFIEDSIETNSLISQPSINCSLINKHITYISHLPHLYSFDSLFAAPPAILVVYFLYSDYERLNDKKKITMFRDID